MIGVLIPTRNRPTQITRILKSISNNDTSELEVVVVSSGERLDSSINPFKTMMKLTYIHSDMGGQIHQKIQGLSAFSKEVKWVVFFDDDLLVPRNFFTLFMSQTSDLPKHIVGVGMNLGFTGKQVTTKPLGKLFSRLFLLSGNHGEIRRSGHACSYMLANSKIETQWLSGASAWRYEYACMYNSVHQFSRYAAYEDVIYSYWMSKKGELIYIPELTLDYQEVQSNDVPPLLAFISAQYWRYYLVKSDNYFSAVHFFWSQVGRNIFYLLTTRGKNFTKIAKANWQILKCEITKGDPKELLIKNC
jgi:glycosyltransferase involved in cell wall biosynthesis